MRGLAPDDYCRARRTLRKGASRGLPEGATAGVRGRALDHHHSRAEMRPEAPTAGVANTAVARGESAGVTKEGEIRYRRRGERRHYPRKIAGITGGRSQALPEGASTGVTGGATVGGAGQAECWPERRAQQLRERREEGLSQGREEGLPDGSSAGITGRGDCRRDRRRRALTPPLSLPVTSVLSSSGNASSRHFSLLDFFSAHFISPDYFSGVLCERFFVSNQLLFFVILWL